MAATLAISDGKLTELNSRVVKTMGMRFKSRVAAALAVCLVAAVVILVWMQLRSDVSADDSHVQVSLDGLRGSAPALPAERINEPPTVGRLSKSEAAPVLGATSENELWLALSARGVPMGEEAYIRIQVAQICEEQLAINSHMPRTESAKVVESFRERFCPGYGSSLAIEQMRLLSLPADDVHSETYGMADELFRAAARGEEGTKDVQAISSHLNDVMLSDEAGFASVLASEALQQVGYVSPHVQRMAESREWSLTRADLATAQVLGTQMRMCARFGGCGPNQLFTIMLCAMQSNCRHGASADAHWRQHYSPSIYNAARAISALGP